MHAPRPYGLFVDGGELTERDKTFISHQMRKLTNTIQTEEVTNYRHEYELPDGGYVIVQDMGGIFKAIARKKENFEKFEPDGFARLYVPMLFSGVVTMARPRKPDQERYGQGVGINITEQCRNRLRNYNPKSQAPAKQLELQRFIVELNLLVVPEFAALNPNNRFTTTQYLHQRPTWYSGAMIEVMQIVGGYGRQDLNKLPESPIERARFLIPDKYIGAISDKLKGYRLPAYTGIPPIDGKYQYDYKHSKTNAVTFDISNKPWLLRIGLDGVYAMPLPIVPATTTDEFRQYITEVGDDELLKILDRFGGMPSGEGFPSSVTDFEAWRRAGVIIKVCGTSDFYDNAAYSSACGWSFNLSGTEGFNTCHSFDSDGIIIGKSYKIQLQFNPANNIGWLKTEWLFENESDLMIVNTYLQALSNFIVASDQVNLAIRYKIGRQNSEQILSRAKANPVMDRKEVLYWNNLELEPIAKLTGKVSKVLSGSLYHWLRPEAQPQIKFPSVEMFGCISFNFNPSEDRNIPANSIPRCDTVMYGYYVGNNLKVIKYFLDTRVYTQKAEGNFEAAMTVGEWSQTEFAGDTSLNGNFYTSDLDLRQVLAPTQITTKIKGADKGYDSTPYFSFDEFFSMGGTMWRNRYYTHLTNTTKIEGIGMQIAMCVPFFCRNSDILALRQDHLGETKTESLYLKAMRDPTTYQYWTYDRIFAWSGGIKTMIGSPKPKDGNPVWAEIMNYAPTINSDFADNGEWLPALPHDVTSIVHPKSNEWQHSGGGGPPKSQEYSKTTLSPDRDSGKLYITIDDDPYLVSSRTPVTGYFDISPNEYGEVFYRDACRVGFGDSEYVSISESGDNNLRKSWGYSALVDHKSAHHFIGVINE